MLISATGMFGRLISDEARYARRLARIARWDRPIGGPMDRARAWANMLFVDHAVFRLVYLNVHRVSDTLWRSAQPSPHQIRAFARRGVRTIVNLRGGREHGSWALEKEACDREGLILVDFVVRSRGAPDRASLLAAPAFLDGLTYPALIHCKSGADRAGFVAALYLLLREGKSAAEAARALHWRFGHFRFAKTGILDAFFEAYAREGESQGIAFLDWATRIYDPVALERSFRAGFWSNLLVDRLLGRE